MKKQFVLTRLGLSGIVVGVLIVGLAVGFAAQSGQRGPASPAAPCGPSIVGELGTNTAKNSRCFELRMYTVDTSKSRINDLHKRFRDGEVDIFKKSGMEVLGVWQSLDDPNTLVYLLAHKDRAASVHRYDVQLNDGRRIRCFGFELELLEIESSKTA